MSKTGYGSSKSEKTRRGAVRRPSGKRRRTAAGRTSRVRRASPHVRKSSPRVRKASASSRSGRRFGWFPAAVCALAVLAAAALLLRRPVEKRLYPMRYNEFVTRFADEYGLDPCLVFAVIKVESDFTPDAVSRTGARGLMQLMPATADWVAWRLGREYDEDRIFEPEYNIEMGCYLLGYLLDRYDGRLDFTLAAYNAGTSAVDGWLASAEYYDGSVLIIPYDETDAYVAKVTSVYESYKELYHEKYCD